MVWLLLAACTPTDAPDYRGWQVARVAVHDDTTVEALRSTGVDVLTEHALHHADVLLPPSGPPRAWDRVYAWATLHGDVQQLIDGQWRVLPPTGDFFEDWRTLTEFDAHLDELALSPVAEVIELGTSVEGRPIRGLRLAAGVPDGRRGTVITGLHHAREWVAGASAMYIADTLVNGYGVDPDITALLDTEKVWVVPVVNPDGYRYTWTTDRLWRKNRLDNGDGTFGVDLNRNYNDHFGEAGAGPVPGGNNYHGLAPFSEAETAAIRDLLQDHPELDRYVDLHCTGQFVLYPWAWTPDPSLDHAETEVLADDISAAMAVPWGTVYDPGQWNTRLYPASGTAIDWAYGVHGARSFLFELRDKGQYGFLLPADQLLPTAEEAFEGVWTVLQQPEQRLKLRLPPLIAGDHTFVQAHRATPGATVELYLSTTGPGTTTLLDGTALELDGAVNIGTRTAGPFGGAEFRRWVEPAAVGREAWFQAREVGGARSLPQDRLVE